MAKILVVGGGFAGVIAAESLAKQLDSRHEVTLVSRSRQFLFYPGLVRFAFGQCTPNELGFDLREAMLDRGVSFVQAEVARIVPDKRRLIIAGGDLIGEMPYDFLVLAFGRRLATERVTGFYENAHHLLTLDATLKFAAAVDNFHQGHAVIGSCPGARLPVPLFETAFALSRTLKLRGEQSRCTITVVSDETPAEMFGGATISERLLESLETHGIGLVSDFPISQVTPTSIIASDGRTIDCSLRMLVPPFCGPSPVLYTGLTGAEGYVRVETTMRAVGEERIYAAGDCISFPGPKLGHMAVRQGEVAAANLGAEIEGRAPDTVYDHELMLVIDTSDHDSIFLHQDQWIDEPGDVHQSRFWAWAKRQQERYWKSTHD
jgi:NADH dehydrogenase FAD-containing subunit